MAEEYKAGSLIEDIAIKFGVSRGAVLRAARRAGLPKRSKRKFDEGVRIAALRDYEKGIKLALISERYGTSEAVICKWRDEEGLNKRNVI